MAASSSLHDAVAHGSLDDVKLIIGQCKDVNEKNNEGLRPLEIAIMHRRLEIVEFFMNKENKKKFVVDFTVWYYAIHVQDIDIIDCLFDESTSEIKDMKDHKGETLLHLAVFRRSLDLVDSFITRFKMNVNSRTFYHSTPLHYAVIQNDLQLVKILLENNADINAKTIDGMTSLHYAVQQKSNEHEILSLLLEKNINLDCKDIKGRTALHIAVENNCETSMNMLLRSGADKFCKDNKGFSLLHVAVDRNNENLVKLLLQKGLCINDLTNDGDSPLEISLRHQVNESMAKLILNHNPNLNIKNKYGSTPIFTALINHCEQIAKEIFLLGVDTKVITNDGSSLLHFALRYENEFIANKLIESDLDIFHKNSLGQTALHLAAKYSGLAMLKKLIDKDMKIDEKTEDGTTALHNAVINRNRDQVLDIVSLLVTKMSDINAENNKKETPLYWAVRFEHNPLVIEFLLQNGANTNHIAMDNTSPLEWAIIKGQKVDDRGIETLLLTHGADVNKLNNNDDNALHVLSKYPKDTINRVKFYLEKGANVNQKNKKKETPLHLFLEQPLTECILILLEHGAELTSNEKGENPLLLAIKSGKKSVIELFLQKGIDINDTTVDGSTALHYAVQKYNSNTEGILQLLLDSQADINKKNNNGQTPLIVATEIGYVEIVNILVERGAAVNENDNFGKSPLYYAVCSGNLEMVKLILKKGALVTESYGGSSIYDVANEKGFKHIYQLLLLF